MTKGSAVFESTTTAVLRRASMQAMKAPSIHNTQPWRFVLAEDRLDICIDTSRHLPVLDPRGRQLVISCGCAVMNARIAIAAAGYAPVVERFSSPDISNVVARLQLGAPHPRGHTPRLDAAIERRRTNRRRYLADSVPDAEAARLVRVARTEGVQMARIQSRESRSFLAELLTAAARVQAEDPAYLKELLDWTTDDPRRLDGVPSSSIPYAGHGAPRITGTPLRQFDLRATGWLPSATALADETLFVLCTDTDEPQAWLRAGEALELVWLELTAAGFSASPIGHVVEVRGTHERLRQGLQLAGHPQLLLRVGRAVETPATPRRAAWDVINTDG